MVITKFIKRLVVSAVKKYGYTRINWRNKSMFMKGRFSFN